MRFPPKTALSSAPLFWAAFSISALAAPDFHADVAPLLRDYCSACHSGKEKEGDLNLETFANLKQGGENGSPLPKAAGESSLLQKVIHGTKPAMPPKKEPQPTETDLAVLDAWLKAGAPGPTAPDVSILTLVTVPELPLKIKAPRALTAATTSMDGSLVATARYQSIDLEDAATRTVRHHFAGLPGKVTSLEFSRDGKRLAAASGIAGISGSAHVWRLETPEAAVTLGGEHRDLVYAVRWSPDGRLLATAGYDAKIVLWDMETHKPVRTLAGHNGAVFDIAFSPDGTLLASASGDQTVKVWRVKDGTRLDTLKEPQGEQFSVAFTPDGSSIVAAGADRRIRLWSLKSRDKTEINPMLHSRFAHEATINALSILPSGDRLVSSALDRSLKIWSLPALELIEVLPPQADTLTSLHPVQNGKRVLVSRMDGSLEALELPATRPTAASPPQAQPTAPAALTQEAAPKKITEIEPNNLIGEAQAVAFPAEIVGSIGVAGDVDTFAFQAKKDEQLTFEVFAEREKSTLDSRLEIRDAQGKPVERLALQATRSSWLTFRGKDATTSADFRIQHWPEMELNEFLYCNGEVVKLWMYPRGPDSGFIVYPGQGTRQSYFDTTPLSHPMGQTVYTVTPLPAGSKPAPNGLPVFRLPYENDDDASREAGRDSVLHFTAPAEGTYQLRLTDARGFGGATATYRLQGRHTQPDFSVSVSTGTAATVSPGSGREFQLKAIRKDGFAGGIRVDIDDLPPGFTATTPLFIEPGQNFALGALYAEAGITKPTPEVAARTKIRASATIAGREIQHLFPGLGAIKVGPKPKVTASVYPTDGKTPPKGQAVELFIHPGETITAKLRAQRLDFKERIEFGGEDSGRNLPHGVYVDNIGLNGLLIPEETTERDFFLTATKWAPEGRRQVFFRAKGDGGQVTPAVWLNVRAK